MCISLHYSNNSQLLLLILPGAAQRTKLSLLLPATNMGEYLSGYHNMNNIIYILQIVMQP